MNLFELFVKIGVDDQASGKLKDISEKLGNGLKTAAKIGTAAVATAAAGITALTTAAVNSFAEYEQLAGGAQKIFDQMDYSKIAADANNAYKELGLSANQYLAVINDVGATFAATMGDEAGYESAKTGLKAISDYASGTGKSVDELSQKFTLITRSTSSYQSIADQFSGILPATSAGFLEQAQAAGILSDSYTQLTEVPIEEYQAAVSQMLQQGVADLGLANNTMNEAFSTLSGSLAMAKSAWSNLVTGLADDSADLDMLIGNFVESVGAVATNLIPKIGTALNGASKLVRDLIPVIVQEIPVLIEENLPILAEAAISIVKSLAEGIWKNVPSLLETVVDVVLQIVNTLTTPEQLNRFLDAALTLVLELTKGIINAVPNLINAAMELVMNLINFILDENNLNAIINTALEIIMVITEGLVKAIPQLVDAAIKIIEKLCDFFLDPENIAMLLDMAFRIVVAIVDGLGRAASELVKGAGKLIEKVIEVFKSTDWGQLGKNIVDGLKNGISNAWNNLVKWFKGLFGDLIGIAKKILGIASPSKVFKKLGSFTAEGFGVGFEDEFARVKSDMEDALTFDDASIGINASVRKIGNGTAGTQYGGVNVVQNIYSEAKTAADLMQEAIYQQERAVLLGV